MYSITLLNPREVNASEILLYSDESPLLDFKLETAELSLKEGSAGSLKLKVAPSHPNYGAFFYSDGEPKTLALAAVVKRDIEINGIAYTDLMFTGRLIEVNTDFNNNITVTFEGAYNYLLDTIQTPYTNTTVPSLWFTYLIAYHNAMVLQAGEPWKCIDIGTIDDEIDSGNNFTFYANNETSLSMVNNVFEGWSMHPVFEYAPAGSVNVPKLDNGVIDPNYTIDTPLPILRIHAYKNYRTDAAPPEIIFGENLMDYTRECKNEEPATVIIPLGDAYDEEQQAQIMAQQAEHPNEPNTWLEPLGVTGLEMRRTIYSVHTDSSNNRSQYLSDTDATNLARFGYICKTVEFDTGEGDDAYTKLLAYGQKYLQDQKWNKTTLSFSAFDLTLLGYNYQEIKMGVNVHCLSDPHDLNRYFPCTAMTVNLLDISASTYTLGDDSQRYISDSSRKTDEKLKDIVVQGVNRERRMANRFDEEINGTGGINDRLDGMDTLTEKLQEDIDAIIDGPSALVEVAKNNALSLLNIYDAERNPVNKGYVHFVKEDVNYNPVDKTSMAKIQEIGDTYCVNETYHTNFTRAINTIKNDFNRSNTIVFAIFGELEWQVYVGIYVVPDQGIYQNKGVIIQSDGCFAWGNGSRYWLVPYSSGSPSTRIYSSSGNVQNSIADGWREASIWTGWTNSYMSYNSTPVPKYSFFQSSNFKCYVNRDLYDTQGNLVHTANLTLEDEPGPEPYNGHITEIVISDTLDYLDSTAGCWRWNKTGLYFLSNGYHPSDSQHVLPDGEYGSPNGPLRLALTRDGHIVADHITAGKLDAHVIRAGVLLAGEDPNNAKFELNIEDGTMVANKASLVFNNLDQKTGDKSHPSSAIREYAYFSNQKCGEYISVGGKNSNEWMLIVGNGFGVDGFGRAVMREADIGGTGGIFDVAARNEDFVTCGWAEGSSTDTLKFKIEINSDSYRPSFVNDASEYAECHYYWALGVYDANGTYYASNDPNHEHPIKKVSAINDLVFNPGWKSVTYENMDFSPAITRTHGSSDANPYYAGQLFPIFFKSNGTEVETDYQVFVEDKLPDGHSGYLDQYRGYSGRHWKETNVDSTGTIHIGSGYLENGTTGQNRSFYLGGIKRSATVAQNARNDWRFTVGSSFGVTENGNLYAHNCYLNGVELHNISGDSLDFRNVHADHLTVNSLSGVNLYGQTPRDGGGCTLEFKLHSEELGSLFSQNTTMQIFAISKQETGGSTIITPEDIWNAIPTNNSYVPHFTVEVGAEFHRTNRSTGADAGYDVMKRGEFAFNLVKPPSGTVYQTINAGDSSSWNQPFTDDTYSYDYFTGRLYYTLTLENPRTTQDSIRPSFEIASTSMDCRTDASGYLTAELTFTFTELYADQYDNAIIFPSRKVIMNYLGTDLTRVSLGYFDTIHYKTSVNDSSQLYKENIVPIEQKYDYFFDRLKPVRFDYKKNFMSYEARRTGHTGFIMEEVKEAMNEADISDKEFGGYAPSADGIGGGLNYNEFIALNTWEIQKLKRENDELKDRLSKLEAALYEKDILD